MEYLQSYRDMEYVLLEFGGWQSRSRLEDTLGFVLDKILGSSSLSKLEWVAACDGDPNQVLEILYSVGFCGLEDADRGLTFYSYQQTYAEAKALCRSEAFVSVHPAFRRALYLA